MVTFQLSKPSKEATYRQFKYRDMLVRFTKQHAAVEEELAKIDRFTRYGESLYREPLAVGFDPSRPGLVPYRYPLATGADVDRAVTCAQQALAAWQSVTLAGRAAILTRIAQGLRAARGELIAAMVLDSAKRVEEADVEVSEAIDFAEYYARSLLELCADPSV